jgi:ribose/xylose/arabinose/galactoside ABC-type transport system permease subunit
MNINIKTNKTDGNINLRNIMQNYGIIIGFILIFVILSVTAENFFKVQNFLIILRQVSCIGIASLGVGMLIIMNAIDLSVGSMFALTGVCAGLMVSTTATGQGMPAILAYAVGIATGVIFGAFNGIIIAKGKIPPFIVTMGTMSIVRGLALILAHGMPVGNFTDEFNYLGTSFIDPWKIVPWTVVIYVLVILLIDFILRKRPFGRHIYAVGGNEEAARAAGINVDAVKIKAYLLNGALLGFAGTLMASRLKSAAPALGAGYELDAIAGCIIGGISFTGGLGNAWSAVLGATIIGTINNGMDLLGVDAFYKQIVKGAIIIIAVLIDRKRTGRA